MDSLNPVWPSPSAAKKMVSRLLPHKGVLIADRIKTMNKPAPAIQGMSDPFSPGQRPFIGFFHHLSILENCWHYSRFATRAINEPTLPAQRHPQELSDTLMISQVNTFDG